MTAGGPVIRAERDGEREALIALWQEAWQAGRPDIDFAARRAWFEDFLAGLVASGHRLLVAEAEGVPAAFATIDPATGYLDTLAVSVAFQRRGLARRLLDAASARAAPLPVTLKVNALNLAGRALYAASGFEEYGRERKPENGETVILMRRAAVSGA
jgi:putative acetyltransferase